MAEISFFSNAFFLFILCCCSCFSEISINEYDQRSFPRIDLDRTATEFRNSNTFVALLSNGQLFACSYGKVIDTPKIPQGKKVKEIFSSDAAFTILLDDGKILCFGDINLGGTTPIIPPERKVVSVFSNKRGFSAILDNGTAIAWGTKLAIPDKLKIAEDNGKKVLSITPAPYAFAAVLEDPVTFRQTIISWGDHYTERYYFRPKPENHQFDETVDVPLDTKVTSIAANDAAFTALYENGEIYSWGDQKFGNIASAFFQKKVLSLTSAQWATIATLEDGTIQLFGDRKHEDIMPSLPKGTTISSIFCNGDDFIAILNTGNIVSWGICPPLREEINPPAGTHIQSLIMNKDAFLGLLDNGNIICGGDSNIGGNPPPRSYKKVVSLSATDFSFTELYEDGLLRTWGTWGFKSGKDIEAKTPKNFPYGRHVESICSSPDSYIALLDDGSLFVWGINIPDGRIVFSSKTNRFFNWLFLDSKTIRALWIASPFEKNILKE
ncbi:MAG: RCC1 domain-containing protein [Verrucomicrobiota bacterium]